MSNDLKRKSDQIDQKDNDVEQGLNEEKTLMTRNGSIHSKNSNVSDYANKIKSIISSNFDQEISYKQFELEKIDEVVTDSFNLFSYTGELATLILFQSESDHMGLKLARLC